LADAAVRGEIIVHPLARNRRPRALTEAKLRDRTSVRFRFAFVG